MKRKIVMIDEEKCNGCGLCVPSCAEGALKIIDGKAKLVSDVYCDGLGACLGECPQDAISIEEREADEFDERAARIHAAFEENTGCATCASANVARLLDEQTDATVADNVPMISNLGHWPLQLALVPPNAPFLENADLLITADCVPFAYPAFHRDFLKGHAVIVACSKLDDVQAHLEKLTAIFKQASVRSVKVLRMEVPCCSGLTQMTRVAMQKSGKSIPVEEVVIGIKGNVLSTVKA